MQESNKSLIAKLLAAEDLTVVHDNVKTAAFDVKNRVLILPILKDTIPETEDHMIGHEVGHALFTPLDGWHDAVCEHGSAYKSYLNVVEDARIEKLVQRKYPGLKRKFITSYKHLLAEGFFGGDIPAINKMNLIDRLNVFFKCGMTSGIKFHHSERVWIEKMNKLETWEDVVSVADELFAYAKQMKEKTEAEQAENAQQDLTEDGEGEGEGESQDPYGQGGDGGDQEQDSFEDGEESENDYQGNSANGSDGIMPQDINDDIKSDTDKHFRDELEKKLHFDGRKVKKFKLLKHDPKDYVKDYKEVIAMLTYQDHPANGDLSGHRWPKIEEERLIEHMYTDWYKSNKRAVNHMVKEFEMRKSAAQYARATLSKTGVIDTVKMNKYKLTDDIFRKVSVVPDGKNHGFIFYLDMSGSMGYNMSSTVRQLLMLVHFARQINVPFRVFGFTNGIKDPTWKTDENGNRIDPYEKYAEDSMFSMRLTLLEFFNNKMTKAEMAFVSSRLIGAYATYKDMSNISAETHMQLGTTWTRRLTSHPMFRLHGTPLNDALVVGIEIAKQFRKDYQIDSLNTIFLTDGVSHGLDTKDGSVWIGIHDLLEIKSPHTGKVYKKRDYIHRAGTETDMLVRMYKDETHSNVINYFLSDHNKTRFLRAIDYSSGSKMQYTEEADIWKDVKKHFFAKVSSPIAFDEVYILSEKSMELPVDAMAKLPQERSKAKIRSAFKKTQHGSQVSRKLLSDLVERVA